MYFNLFHHILCVKKLPLYSQTKANMDLCLQLAPLFSSQWINKPKIISCYVVWMSAKMDHLYPKTWANYVFVQHVNKVQHHTKHLI